MEDDASPRGSQAINRAIGILRAFDADRTALTATEVAAELDVSVPTALRIARTLEQGGLLTRDGATKAHSHCPEILRLARLMTESRTTLMYARALAAIRDATSETASLHMRVGDRRVCIAEEVSRRPIRITSGVGESYPLSAGAAGKAILSLLPDAEVARLLDVPAPDAWPLPPDELGASIREARERGYATSEGETVPGAVAIAVPLPWTGTGPPAAINLVGPRDRIDEAGILEGAAAIQAAISALGG